MAMMQKTCGAVTGACMVIGPLHGRMRPEEAKSLGYFDNKCARYVEDAERILEDLLNLR